MTEEALAAFALLADGERLAVAGVLASHPRTTAEIVGTTGLTQRRVLEALTRLEAGELVSRDDAGRWVVDVPRLQALARDARPKPPPDDVGDAPVDHGAILQRFLRDGRLTSIPMQHSRRLVVLDYAALRRYLVDEGFLDRDANVYWRIGGTVEI